MKRGRAVAVGRLSAAGTWVGFARADEGYELAFGEVEAEVEDEGTVRIGRGPTLRHDLLNVALAYFGDAVDAGPEQIGATHEDVAELVAWLAATEPDEVTARRLRAAVDAIDDGLAADAVMLSLEEAAAAMNPPPAGEQVEPIDLLRVRERELRG